jgi:hypothetical protein
MTDGLRSFFGGSVSCEGNPAEFLHYPKEYDVEHRGKYSAGKFSYPKAAKRSPHKKQSPPVKTEDPSEPWSPTD